MKNLPYQNRSVAKRKNSIENKLSTYLAISGAYLAASPVDAQIIYTDIDPDVEMYLPAPFLGLSHQIDLNNDGVIDFNFVANYFWEQYSSNCSSPCSYIYYDLDLIPWNDNAALANQSPIGMLNSPVVVSSSNYVGSNVSTFGTNVVWWKHRQALARSDIIWGGLNRNGNWLNGETDKYVGLKLEVGGNTHYGWLRLDVLPDARGMVLKDYAYEATPNVPIHAPVIPGMVCEQPDSVIVSNIMDTSVTVSWPEEVNASKYQVFYKAMGVPPPLHKKMTNDTNVTLNGLLPGTTYRLKVRAKCPTIGNSDWQETVFTTATMRNGTASSNVSNASIYSFDKNIHLQIHDWQSGMNAWVVVFDIMGKVVYKSQIYQQSEVLDLTSQPSGVYIVELGTKDGMTRKKVFIR